MDEPVPVLEPVLPRRQRRVGPVVGALAILVLGAAAVWGVLVLARPGASVGPAPRLVVVETGGGLTTMDGFGGSIHRHGLPGVRLQFPAWSPDGSLVAAIGRAGNAASVTVFDADPAASTVPLVIYESIDRPPFYLYWAPDNRNVTFLTTEPVGIALRIAPADGSAASTIVRQAAPLYWDFVDAGRVFVHTGSTGPEAFLGEVGLDGAALEDSAIASGLFRSPAVGGNGTSRAYVAAAGEDPLDGGQVVVEARDGSVRHEIPVRGATAVGFDPTSTTLAFVAPDVPQDPPAPIPAGPLRTVDAATGEVRTLLDANVLAFFWSPDGRTIATLDLRPAEEPEPGEARAVGRRSASAEASAEAAALPPLATDSSGIGLHLSFIDTATAAIRSERDIRVTELFAFQVLPYFDQYALSHRFWASDSSAIVLPLAEDSGLERVVVIPAGGSDPRAVASGSIGFWRP